MKKLKNIPHLFAKATVVYCVAFATFASLCALYIQARGGAPAELLAVILAFFGGELLLLCLKTILKREKPPDEDVMFTQSIGFDTGEETDD